MALKQDYFLFELASHRFALPLDLIDSVCRAVKLEPVFDAPESLLGLMNFHGTAIPVFDPRPKLGLEQSPINLQHRFILLHSKKGKLALLSDHIEGIKSTHEPLFKDVPPIIPALENSGVFIQENGLVVIYDIQLFIEKDAQINIPIPQEDNTP